MNFSAVRYCIAILAFLLLTVCGNPARAVDVASIRALAEQGDAEAENVLGTFYDKDKDYDEALKWFPRLAVRRFLRSLLSLFRCRRFHATVCIPLRLFLFALLRVILPRLAVRCLNARQRATVNAFHALVHILAAKAGHVFVKLVNIAVPVHGH